MLYVNSYSSSIGNMALDLFKFLLIVFKVIDILTGDILLCKILKQYVKDLVLLIARIILS